MDLSHTLASALSTFSAVKQASLLQQLIAHEKTKLKNILNTADNSRYTTTLLLDQNSPNPHGALLDNNHQQQTWLTIKHDSELISNIPAPTTAALINQSQQLLSTLNAKQVAMSQTVEDSAFNAKDALISIIMPGGLLYASHRKFSHTQAKKQLTQTINEQDGLTMDILMLQSTLLAAAD